MSIASQTAPNQTSASSLVDRLPAVIPHEREALDGELWVEVIDHLDGPGGLLDKVNDWDDLAEDVIEPNVFYESWQLIPALRLLAPKQCRFVLIYRRAKRPDVRPRLCGFFPMIDSGGGIRSRRWSLWRHDYCFLTSPLIRRAHAIPVWSTLLDQLQRLPGGPDLLDLPGQVAEGELAQALTSVLYDRAALVENVETYTRALVRKSPDWMTYAAEAMSTHQRRELRRHWRRLSEMGHLTEQSLEPGQELTAESWINSFLDLESRGWKGEAGSAIRAESHSADYFREIARAAYERGRLQMFGLFLNGDPIALKVNFLAGSGSFAFKIAYDEQYAKFSPGVQLELENLRRLHEIPELEWMDSCAVPRHFMINRLWKERRTVAHLRVSLGGWKGNIEIGGRVFLRAIRRSLLSRPKPATSPSGSASVKTAAAATTPEHESQ